MSEIPDFEIDGWLEVAIQKLDRLVAQKKAINAGWTALDTDIATQYIKPYTAIINNLSKHIAYQTSLVLEITNKRLNAS